MQTAAETSASLLEEGLVIFIANLSFEKSICRADVMQIGFI
jgi:hypothetical protein